MKDLLSLIREISKKVIVESQEATLPGDRYYTKEEVEQLIQQSMEELLNKLNEAITGE
jgi:BMFP domain-containing protein YqiC